jgi:hypothetical protein
MYLGALGQQGSTFTVRSQRGERPYCPGGSQEQSRHGQGLRESVTCYRAPVFAPPPTTTVSYEAPRTTVSVPTGISTQVSPQISPAMAQQQASPGAQASSAPASAPGPVSARPSTGITGEDLQRILDAQRAAAKAEADALERQRKSEYAELTRQMSERERASQEIYLAEQKAAADRAAADRFAREQAEAQAQEAAALYAPAGGGALPPPAMPPSVVPSTIPDYAAPPDVRVPQVAPEDETPWALLLMAAAGVGVVVLMGKKGKRKSSR